MQSTKQAIVATFRHLGHSVVITTGSPFEMLLLAKIHAHSEVKALRLMSGVGASIAGFGEHLDAMESNLRGVDSELIRRAKGGSLRNQEMHAAMVHELVANQLVGSLAIPGLLTVAELHTRYSKMCAAIGVRPLASSWFGKLLGPEIERVHGIKQDRFQNQRGWRGLALRKEVVS